MRLTRFRAGLLLFLFLLLPACRGETPPEQPSPAAAPAATPTATVAPPVATLAPEPTPARVTLTIWGPEELAPGGEERGGALLAELEGDFEALHPEIQVTYQPKAAVGPASLQNYIRSASAVAPSVLPDLIIIHSSDLEEIVHTQLLFPLDGLIDDDIRADLFPFATRDTQVDERWMALPLAIEMEQGVTSSTARRTIPTSLTGFTAEGAPIWLFTGQARADGEMSNALLLQLLAITGEMPRPGVLPPHDDLVALLDTLRAAYAAGSLPRQLFMVEEITTLYDELRAQRVELIESPSRSYMLTRDARSGFLFAPVPTLNGLPTTVIEGYLLALTTDDPRQQQAAALYLNWLLESPRLALWSRASRWLPARRTGLGEAVEDGAYRAFLAERLENGWLRPASAAWSGFGQSMQEQFRGVMLEQVTPTEAADTLYEGYGP